MTIVAFGRPQPILTRDSSASGLAPQRIVSPSLSGCSPATGAPLRVSPFLPWFVIRQRPSENVNVACSLDTVSTSGSTSSTDPRPARAPETRVSATEEPVTNRSTGTAAGLGSRSEEHTSELQSHLNLVCRLLLEKKRKIKNRRSSS